jgi:hypothetical protein
LPTTAISNAPVLHQFSRSLKPNRALMREMIGFQVPGDSLDLWLSLVAPNPPERRDWEGLVSGRVEPTSGPSIRLRVPGPAVGSWSSPIRINASDGADYFAKFPESCTNHPRDGMSVVVEMVAAELGRLINAPVCDTVLLEVPAALLGTELRPGIPITSTVVHGSRALANADEATRPKLPNRQRDDNRRRHVGAYAMWDWFIGCDPQWLRDLNDDEATFSHDHGLYLPPHGTGHWTEQELQNWVDRPHRLCDDPQVGDDPQGLSSEAVAEIVAALRDVNRVALQQVLNRVPSSWPVTNDELEGLGWFLERRAPAVAGRIESLSI